MTMMCVNWWRQSLSLVPVIVEIRLGRAVSGLRPLGARVVGHRGGLALSVGRSVAGGCMMPQLMAAGQVWLRASGLRNAVSS